MPFIKESSTRSSYYGTSQYAYYPIINVDWDQASAYCQWAARRLPTEAEWEKAALDNDGRNFPWGNQTPTCYLANFSGCEGDTSAVDSHPAGKSPYGALDMAGNVWEWVPDWYNYNYYRQSPSNNPTGPASGGTRVLRGGAWPGQYIFSYVRYQYPPGFGNDFIGFRCAASS